MMLTESMKSNFEAAFALEEQIDTLNTELQAKKDEIRKALEIAGETTIKQDGYYACISEATRNTLMKDEIEKLFGKIPDSCIKRTSYKTFKIKRMAMV